MKGSKIAGGKEKRYGIGGQDRVHSEYKEKAEYAGRWRKRNSRDAERKTE